MAEFSFWVILSNLLWATQWTIILSLIAFVSGGLVGLVLLFARTSGIKWLEIATKSYIEFFQGTPLLMQLFLFFFGIALFGIEVSAWLAAWLALTFWTSAFLTEIWRGCVESIPKGQWEASSTLALNYFEQMCYVILPHHRFRGTHQSRNFDQQCDLPSVSGLFAGRADLFLSLLPVVLVLETT
jgi:polar amino acid transport system permease protein